MSPSAHTLFLNGRVPLAIFASGSGSNAEAIIHYSFRTSAMFYVRLLVSNNSQCGAMNIAKMYDIPTLHISSQTHPDTEAYATHLLEVLQENSIGMIALAGYMKKMPETVVQAFNNAHNAAERQETPKPCRIFNIHPSLLPKFGGEGMYGMRVHEAVLRAGETESGCTVHEVDDSYDTGTIIAQKAVSVYAGDTPETLAARVLEQEHQLYPNVLQQKSLEIAAGTL